MAARYKLVVFVPLTYTDIVREAMGKAGAGKMGRYSFCSFSSRGVGRFRPEVGANPAIGEVGKLETVEEERVEVVCTSEVVRDVIKAMKEVHPYEEVAYDVFEMIEIE